MLREVRRTAATALFVGGDHERRARRLPQSLGMPDGGDDKRRDAAFHVARTAAVEAPAFEARSEGVPLPRRGAKRHRIDVTGEAEWRLVHRATDARDEARARRCECGVIHVESGCLEQRSEVRRAFLLRTRRVDRVEREQFLREFDGVGEVLHRGPLQCGARPLPAATGSRKWHATTCAGATSASFGSSWRQRSNAYGHRVWKRQPAGRSMGLGTSPESINRLRRTVGSGTGTADSSASVYGCSGLSNSARVVVSSTIRPRYMTATRWLMCSTTARSCATNRYDWPNACCRSTSRLITCACTETSSAETGSSQTMSRGFGASARAMPSRCR